VNGPEMNPRQVGRGERCAVWAGLVLSVALGLAATAHGVFSPDVLQLYATSPDSVDITRWAEKATPETIPLWWQGPWIQQTSPYYRPLSSMVFWAEYLAFGWNFQGHVVVSWLLHATICGLLYWFALAALWRAGAAAGGLRGAGGAAVQRAARAERAGVDSRAGGVWGGGVVAGADGPVVPGVLVGGDGGV